MLMKFKDKTVIVTAGTKGIGKAVVEAFIEEGAQVATCSRNPEILTLENDRLLKVSGDIKELNFLHEFHKSVEDHFDSCIDILVNNNGGPPPGPAISHGEDAWNEAINGNLLSTVRMANLVIPGMIKSNWGRIINLTSATAKEPAPGMVLSNTTRAAVAAFSKTLAHEHGSDGITVNTILTGGVATERFQSLVQKQVESTGKTTEEIMDTINKTIPVGYISSPNEFAKYILFIASEEAKFLTGTAIPIDGGASKGTF
ncbi:MAG: 3-oxoacyl-ACP reductase [Flavobacteriaceae bacterium]|nr:3-oxoacyl-ACP reductase [Flavobacteriaceae bacterium]